MLGFATVLKFGNVEEDAILKGLESLFCYIIYISVEHFTVEKGMQARI